MTVLVIVNASGRHLGAPLIPSEWPLINGCVLREAAHLEENWYDVGGYPLCQLGHSINQS